MISLGCLYSIGKPSALDSATVTSQSAIPPIGVITLRIRLIRRSALVNVPSFSRNEQPGRNTCAYFAVSFRKMS